MMRVYNGDCLKVMDKLILDGIRVDCIITDPPYKITARGNGGNSGGMFQKKEVNNGKVFKHNDIEIQDWLPRCWDILKDGSHMYIMTNNKNITDYLEFIKNTFFNGDKSKKFRFIKTLIWVKDNKIMGQSYMSQFEYIIMLAKGTHKKINNCGQSDVLQIKNRKIKDLDGKTIHDTEKPVELTDVLISNSTKENEVILDFAMGIGGCGISCVNANRNFIGIELDKKYFDIAKQRIQDAVKVKKIVNLKNPK